MFGLQQKVAARELGDDGMVACPARRVRLDYEHCLGCSFLEDLRFSEDGVLIEIRCVSTAGIDASNQLALARE